MRRARDGAALVGWKASVVHPDLQDGDRLVTGPAGTAPVTALDRDGGEITTDKYPSLGTVLDEGARSTKDRRRQGGHRTARGPQGRYEGHPEDARQDPGDPQRGHPRGP